MPLWRIGIVDLSTIYSAVLAHRPPTYQMFSLGPLRYLGHPFSNKPLIASRDVAGCSGRTYFEGRCPNHLEQKTGVATLLTIRRPDSLFRCFDSYYSVVKATVLRRRRVATKLLFSTARFVYNMFSLWKFVPLF